MHSKLRLSVMACSPVSSHRKALTLIELLIVMAILSLLAGIALPNIKTMIKQQRLSRSASAIQSYIDAARSKAIGTGQSYGVVIERSGFDSSIARSQSIRLRFAYAPPDYSGDVPEALAVVLPSGNLAFSPMHAPTLVAAAQQRQAQRNGAVVDPIVRPLDLISIGSVGLTASINEIRFATASDFVITAQNPAEFVVPGFVPDSSGSNTSDWPRLPSPTDAQISGWPVIEIRTPSAIDFDPADQVRRVLLPGTAISFRVTRRPRPSILTPMDLVEGTVIDLNYSGIGIGNFTFAPTGIELTAAGIGARAFHEGPFTTQNPAPD
jgi:prepilin-type N-terminal cleavage/methylation domain-containing protein